MKFERQPSKNTPLTGSGLLPPILILIRVKLKVMPETTTLNPEREMAGMSVLIVYCDPIPDSFFATVTVNAYA